MAVETIEIGRTYYMGNSFNPEACQITHLVGFADLPEASQRAHSAMASSRGLDARAATYVGFYSQRKHDAPRVRAWRTLSLDVFKGVVFDSLDAFYAARAAEPGPAGLLRCTLPGEASREGRR